MCIRDSFLHTDDMAMARVIGIPGECRSGGGDDDDDDDDDDRSHVHERKRMSERAVSEYTSGELIIIILDERIKRNW